MKTNTQYVKDAKKIKVYHNNQMISVVEAAGMTRQMLDAHFANVAIKSSIVHVITKEVYKSWDKYHQFPVKRISKRYRLPKRS